MPSLPNLVPFALVDPNAVPVVVITNVSPGVANVVTNHVGLVDTMVDLGDGPGNGADHLLTYQFAPSFASGLTSVQIDATRWAMDNLVFVIPEPSTLSLAALGLCFALGLRRGSLKKLK